MVSHSSSKHYVTLSHTGSNNKLQRKLRVLNTVPGIVLTKCLIILLQSFLKQGCLNETNFNLRRPVHFINKAPHSIY
jgi:hypothetical protein